MTSSDTTMNGTYNLFLVAFSILVAVIAAYAILELAARVTATSGRAGRAWLAGGSVAMGLGIWSMHFIGMLAFSIRLPITYDVPTALVSMAVAIATSLLALYVVSRENMGGLRLAWSSVLVAAGILGMHYVGMEGIRMQANISYDLLLLVFSAVLAFGAALAALWLAHQLRGYHSLSARGLALKLGSALTVGGGLAGMHYTSMAAGSFTPTDELNVTRPQEAFLDTSLLAAAVAVTTFVILGIAILAAILNRRFKAQESALEESEELNRAVVETAPNAIVIMSSEGLIQRFNSRAEKMFGHAAGEVIGQPLSIIMPERFREPHERGFRRYLQTGEARVLGRIVELAGLRKDGEEFPVELSIGEVRHGDDRSFVGIIRDVTERKEADKELKENERRFRQFFEQSVDALLIHDERGNIVDANSEAARSLGYTRREMLSLNVRDFATNLLPQNGRVRRPEKTLWQRAMEAKPGETVGIHRGEHRRKDGTSFPVEVRVGTVEQRGEKLILASARDVTERVEAENQLRDSKERFRSLSDATFEGIAISEDGKLLEANRSFADMFGYELPEIKGMKATEFIAPEYRELVLQKISSGDEEPYEAIGLKKDGTTFDVAIRGRNTSYRGRDVRVTAIRDITERKRAEQKLRESQERLQAVVGNAPVILFALDQDGVFTVSEGRGLEALGRKGGEVVGRSIFDVYPDNPQILENTRRALAGEAVSSTVEIGDLAFDAWYSPLRDETGEVAGIIGVAADVTERKKHEEEIRTTNTRLSTLIESLHAGILVEDNTRHISHVNQEFCDMFSVPAPPEALIGADCSNAAEESKHLFEEPEEFVSRIDELLRQRQPVTGEELSLADGHTFERDYIPIFVDGSYEGHLWQYRDITGRKRAREELVEKEARFRTLFEQSAIGVCVADLDRRIIEANAAYEELTGYSAEELVGMSTLELTYPDDLEAEQSIGGIPGGSLLTTDFDTYQREKRYVRKNGEVVWANTASSLVRDEHGEPRFIMGVVEDVTDRKRAEEELREAEERFRAIFEEAAVGIALATPDRVLTEVNRTYQEMVGYTREELIGKPIAELTHPDDVTEDEELNQELVEGKLNRYQREKRYIRKDGEVIWVLPTVTTVRDERGEPLFLVSMVEDITERKKTRQELAKAKEEAESANQAKSDFLANMSHEIRTPMNGVIGMADLLMDTNLDDEQQEYVETVRNSGETLLALINDILDLSKIEAERIVLEDIVFDLRTSVEDTTVLLAERAQSKGLEIASLVDYDVPTALRGDPGRLRQILTNLLGNAIKFTEEGEVVLRAELSEETEEQAVIRFEISDTGIGMDEEKLERLFEAFSQADASTTRRYGGTGLGLTISKELVDIMGGEIWVESEPGVGSTFYFTARFEKHSSGVQTGPQPRADLRGVKTLIVDDNATNRSVLRHQVTPWGMEVDDAKRGQQALEKLRAAAGNGDPYDLALLDMQMPNMDGLELARAIKEDPEISDTRLVILTSMGQRGYGEDVQRAGIEAYLTKPVRQDQLYDTLTTVMGAPGEKGESSEDGRQLVTAHTLRESESRSRPRLLLAEDDEVNQKVAVRTLEKLGYRVDVADDGEEAVEAVERTDYSAVVMDIQMPNMDGYEATAEIRRREGEDGGHLPIIAMTAGALQGDREKALEAGMDDYIAKPVKAEEMKETLQRWIESEELGVQPQEESTDDAVAEDGALDPAVLSGLEELQQDGEQDVVAELAGIFLEDAPSQIETLREALENGNAPAVQEAVHTLKGSSGNIGARQMRNVCAELQETAESGELERATELLQKLEKELERVRPELEERLEKDSDGRS